VEKDKNEGRNREMKMLNTEHVLRIGKWKLGIKQCGMGIAECAACSTDFRQHCKLKGGIYHEERIERAMHYEQGHGAGN
jgi:hypothetical protein